MLKAKTKRKEKVKGKTSKGFNAMVDLLTMVKRVNVNYSENRGTILPGYNQSVGFVGTLRPTTGFIFGSQQDVRFLAAKQGWLTTQSAFTSPYVQNKTQQLTFTATANPTKDITIDLNADRTYSFNLQDNYAVYEWEQKSETGLKRPIKF